MARSFEEIREEGAEMIAKDTMPKKGPSESELKAKQLAKEFATETLDEKWAKLQNAPEKKKVLEDSFDQAIESVMFDLGLSADDHGKGEAFYQAAQAEKAGYVKFLMNEMVNKAIDDPEVVIKTSGREYQERLKQLA